MKAPPEIFKNFKETLLQLGLIVKDCICHQLIKHRALYDLSTVVSTYVGAEAFAIEFYYCKLNTGRDLRSRWKSPF